MTKKGRGDNQLLQRWLDLANSRVPWLPIAAVVPWVVALFFYLYWNWCSTLAMADRHAGLASWAEAIGTVGAICAAITMPVWERARRIRHDQTIAAMRVAASLRAWLRVCAASLQELQRYNKTDGNLGSYSTAIPPLEFDMEQVALMSVRHARIIYSIIEQRERAVGSVAAALELVDQETAETEYVREMAKLFRRCRWRYIQIAKDTGLHPYTSQPWELTVIDKAAEEGGVRSWTNLGLSKE